MNERLFHYTEQIAACLSQKLGCHFQAVDRYSSKPEVLDKWGVINEIGEDGQLTGRTLSLFIQRGEFRRSQQCKININGVYPSSIDGDGYYPGYDHERNERKKTPEIVISAHRSPHHVAGDIARRFWPDYIKEYEEAIEQIADRDKRIQRKAAIEKFLIEVGGGSRNQYNRKIVSNTLYEEANWEAKVDSNGRVDLVVRNLDPEVAGEILALLAPQQAVLKRA